MSRAGDKRSLFYQRLSRCAPPAERQPVDDIPAGLPDAETLIEC